APVCRAAKGGFPQLPPRLPGVGRLPDGATRAAAVEAASAAPPLMARRVQDVAVRRIDRDVREAGVVVDELDFVPRPAAVRRLVDAAVGARSEQMAGR